MENTVMNGLQESWLSELPPELRNRIWDYVFAGLEHKLIMPLLHYVREWKKSTPTHHNCKLLALLLTCKQIHSEASGIAWTRIAACGSRLVRYKPTMYEIWDLESGDETALRKHAAKYGPDTMEISSRLTTLLSTKLKFIQELTLTDKMTLKWMEGRGEEEFGHLPKACASMAQAMTGIRTLNVNQSHIAERAGEDPWVKEIAADGKDFDALLKTCPKLNRLVVISPRNAIFSAKMEAYSIAGRQVTHEKSGIVVYDGENEPYKLWPKTESENEN